MQVAYKEDRGGRTMNAITGIINNSYSPYRLAQRTTTERVSVLSE